MAIVWLATKLVITSLIAKAFGQTLLSCPKDKIVFGPGRNFSGSVSVSVEDVPQYALLDNNRDLDNNGTGIHFLVGCQGNETTGLLNNVVLRLKNGTETFILQQDPGRMDNKILQLKPGVSYTDLLALPQSFNIVVEVGVLF